MALRVRVKNPDVNREEFTNFTSDLAAGVTALTVASNDDFAANDIVCLGNPGEEQTELRVVSSVSGSTTINVSATSFPHAAGQPVYKMLYNQISLERATSSGGSFSEIAEGKINIDIDSKDGFTIISVAAGATTDYFKWRFYNSGSGNLSGYSDTLAGTGLGRTAVGYLISEFRTFARSPDHKKVSDEQIIRWFNDCQDRIEANYDRWWFLLTSTDNTTTADDYDYALPSDFARMEAVIFDDGELEYRLHYVPLAEFDQLRIDNATAPSDDSLRAWTMLPPDTTNIKGYIGVYPTPDTSSLTLRFRYYKEMPTLDSFGDITLVPVPEVLVNFALSQFWKSKGQNSEADYYYAQYMQGIELLKRLQRREVGEADIFKWRGHRGRSKLFGSREGVYSDTQRENYW